VFAVSPCESFAEDNFFCLMASDVMGRRLSFAVGQGRFLNVNRFRGRRKQADQFIPSTHSSLRLPLSCLQRGLISSVTRCKSSRKYQHLLTLPSLHATLSFDNCFAQACSSIQKPPWPNQPLKLALPMYVQCSSTS
jgi:hypothetical protein